MDCELVGHVPLSTGPRSVSVNGTVEAMPANPAILSVIVVMWLQSGDTGVFGNVVVVRETFAGSRRVVLCAPRDSERLRT